MSLAWSKLVEIREEIPVAGLGVKLDTPVCSLPLVGESPHALANCRLRDWFKIGSHQFLHARSGQSTSASDSIHCRGFAWAASDGAFARALTEDMFFDDEASQIPPADLLPDGHSYDWRSVSRIGKESGSPYFHDCVWRSVREVGCDRFTFYYRHESPELHEPPFCIMIIPVRKPDAVLMKIEKESAIAIARKFVEDRQLEVGEMCVVSHISRESYRASTRHDPGHGSWIVGFAYTGPPLSEREKELIPPLDSPTAIVVNDVTGDAEVLMLL